MSVQYVTLVTNGGTPVRLADQYGAPYPTTGSGSLVFGNGATLTNPTLIGAVFTAPYGFGMGTALAPSIFFGVSDTNTGIYSSATGYVSFTSGGSLVGQFGAAGLSVTGILSGVVSWQGSVIDVTYGGTGRATLTANGVLYGAGTSQVGIVSAGTTGQILTASTGAAPSWSTHSSIAVTSLSFGTTGLTPSGATTGAVVMAGTLAVANGGTGVTSSTGTGAVVRANTPTLITPVLGVATATSINGLTLTASTGIFTLANAKTLTVSNTLTFTGTDGSTLAIGTGGTLGTAAYQNTGTSGANVPLLNGTNTWSAAQTFSAAISYGGVGLSNSVTGTGSMVLSASPTFTGTITAAVANFTTGSFTSGVAGTGLTITGSLIQKNVSDGNDSLQVRNAANSVIGALSASAADFNIDAAAKMIFFPALVMPAGGTAGRGLGLTTTSNFGIYPGSGAPTLSAAQGSLYMRSNGPPQFNNNGTTGWTELLGAVSVNVVSPTSPNRTIEVSIGGATYYISAKTTND